MAYFQRRGIVPSLKRRTYQSFRAAVREDFRATCAYCLLEEKWAAGLENFEIDQMIILSECTTNNNTNSGDIMIVDDSVNNDNGKFVRQVFY